MSGPHIASVGRLLCLGGAAFGALGFFGWLMGTTFFATLVPGQPPMMPNTALSLLILGVAGALRHQECVKGARRTLSLLGAALVLAIGVGTLAEYALDINLHIDQLFISGAPGPHPGRPSPPTALALTFLGAALLLFDSRPTAHARPSEWLVLSGGFIAFTALLGQLFGAAPLYRLTDTPVIGVAVPTALSLAFTAVGLLFERPNAGVMRVTTAKGPGGVLLRRLTPTAILTPTALGLVAVRVLPSVDVGSFPLIISTLVAVMIVASLFLLTATAVPLNRAHEALELTQARTRDLIDQASDGIFVADLEGRYTDVNRAGCRMLGYSREEIVGKTIVDLIPPEDVERLSRSKELLLEGKSDIGEWTLRCKDGTYLPVEVSAKILPDGRWKGFVRDISERKRAEAALRLAEAKASGIISMSPDAIITVDDNQRITMFNEGAEAIFGYSKAEVIGAPLEILLPERFRAIHRRHMERFATSRETTRRPNERGALITGLRKNGEEFPADASISMLDVGGTRLFTVALRDITEQKRTESEQRFLLDAGSVLVSTLDDESTLRSVAQMAARDLADLCIVDITVEDEELGKRIVASRDPSMTWVCDALMQTPLDRRRPHQVWSALETTKPTLMQGLSPEIIASLAPTEDQLRALRAVDAQSVIVVPLTVRGKLLGVMILVSSTPSRVYGPADVRLAERLGRGVALSIENGRLYRVTQRAVKARDDVLGVVAHDLRNPLGAILMHAALLRRRGAEPERRSQKPAEAIERAATRMNRLIQDLLDVSRIEAGHLSIEQARVSAGQVISDAVEAQRLLAARASLELQLDVARDLPEVWADRDRLLQVFENLIGNAIKFTASGGRIVAGAAPRNGEVLFWVTDTGPGIAAENLPRLFDRFWQAQKAGRCGAGLGLPIVKGIVEAHGGRIWVESTLGRGTTFFFTIPTAPRATAWRSESAPQSP